MNDNEETLQLLAKALCEEARSTQATLQRNGKNIKTTEFLVARASSLLSRHGLTDDPITKQKDNLYAVADIVNNELGRGTTFEVVFDEQGQALIGTKFAPEPCYTGRYRHPIPS